MTPAMQRLRQTLGANLAPEQADAQAREQVGAKLGLSEDQVGIMRITPDFVEVTFPDIANNSGQQRYRLLPEGKLLLEGEGQ